MIKIKKLKNRIEAKSPYNPKLPKKAREIDRIYNGDQEEKQDENFLKSISQPRARLDNTSIYKSIIVPLISPWIPSQLSLD